MSYPAVRIAPSILSADFSDLKSALKEIEDSGADWVHLDVMDGHFVPNLTFGPKMVSDLRPLTRLPFDVHLMIEKPELLAENFISAGADYLVFHIEAVVHAHRLVQRIRDLGARPGISLVPSTPVSLCTEILAHVDQVLVMTVNPGFGGQKIIPEAIEKIRELMRLREENGYDFVINVDGGVNLETSAAVRQAGADAMVSGSAFFSARDKSGFVSAMRGQKIV